MNYMERELEKLTPENFGEMYVKWKLEGGLYSSDEGDMAITLVSDNNVRDLTLNELASEIGMIMLPYLSKNPDVGFESFGKNLKNIAKIGKASYYEGRLTEEYPYSQIINECNRACKNLGKQPSVMIIYVTFGKGQKIQVLQYAHLKCNIYMLHGVKHLDINISHDSHSNERIGFSGTIQIWIA